MVPSKIPPQLTVTGAMFKFTIYLPVWFGISHKVLGLARCVTNIFFGKMFPVVLLLRKDLTIYINLSSFRIHPHSVTLYVLSLESKKSAAPQRFRTRCDFALAAVFCVFPNIKTLFGLESIFRSTKAWGVGWWTKFLCREISRNTVFISYFAK
jgi:hypothetical protein